MNDEQQQTPCSLSKNNSSPTVLNTGGTRGLGKAIFFAKSRMFSCVLDPAVTAGVAQVLQIAGNADGDRRRTQLHANGAFLRAQLQGKVNIGLSES